MIEEIKNPKVSGFVAQIHNIRREAAERGKNIGSVVDQCYSLEDTDLPPIEYINIIGSDTAGHFKDAMCNFFSEIVNRFRITDKSMILDIGCGCGRVAIPFSMYLKSGTYYGVDVWDDGIQWCIDNISIRNSNCRFHLIKSENNYYFNDFDERKQNEYNLYFLDENELDFVFAISLFTHLVENDAKKYFSEIRRTLKDSGAAYITAFIIDKYFFNYVQETGQHRQVKESTPGVYYAYSGQDFFAGFTMKKWREMLDEADLQIVSFETGSWAEKPGSRVYQDTFIIARA